MLAQARAGGCPTGASTLKHDAYLFARPKPWGPSDSVETPVGPPPPKPALKERRSAQPRSRTRTGPERAICLFGHVTSVATWRSGSRSSSWLSPRGTGLPLTKVFDRRSGGPRCLGWRSPTAYNTPEASRWSSAPKAELDRSLPRWDARPRPGRQHVQSHLPRDRSTSSNCSGREYIPAWTCPQTHGIRAGPCHITAISPASPGVTHRGYRTHAP